MNEKWNVSGSTKLIYNQKSQYWTVTHTKKKKKMESRSHSVTSTPPLRPQTEVQKDPWLPAVVKQGTICCKAEALPTFHNVATSKKHSSVV